MKRKYITYLISVFYGLTVVFTLLLAAKSSGSDCVNYPIDYRYYYYYQDQGDNL
jgi:hypothetical protein